MMINSQMLNENWYYWFDGVGKVLVLFVVMNSFHGWGELRTVDSLASRSEMDPHKFKRRRSKLHQIGGKNGGGIRIENSVGWLRSIEIEARRWGIKVVIMRIFLEILRNVLPSECREQITKIYSVQWCIKGTFIIFHQIVITLLHHEMMVLLSYYCKLNGPNCVIIIESRINKRLSLHLKQNSSKIYILKRIICTRIIIRIEIFQNLEQVLNTISKRYPIRILASPSKTLQPPNRRNSFPLPPPPPLSTGCFNYAGPGQFHRSGK